MATVLLSSRRRTLHGNMNVNFGTLGKRLVHPTSPALLTKPGPLAQNTHFRIRSLRVGAEY